MVMLTVIEKSRLSVQDLRLAVAKDLRQHGDMKFIGFDNIEHAEPDKALGWPASGTIFEIIAGSLTKNGVSKEDGYNTLGDVMSGLGYQDKDEAHSAAHWIGCHCHGEITGDIVADRIEGLNTL
jgi:hypothetical protein